MACYFLDEHNFNDEKSWLVEAELLKLSRANWLKTATRFIAPTSVGVDANAELEDGQRVPI